MMSCRDDQGKTLYEAFPKNLWEMAKCDGAYLFDSVSTCKMMREFMQPSTGIIVSDDVDKCMGWQHRRNISDTSRLSEWDKSDSSEDFKYLINGYVFG